MAFGKTPVIAQFFTSFAIYWLILTLGPLLIGTSIAASSYVKAMFEQSENALFWPKTAQFCAISFYLVYLHAHLYDRAK